jgi:hypothetical protein
MGQKNYERIPKNRAYWAMAPEKQGKTLSIHISPAETALLRTPCKTRIDKPNLIT